jgi:aconitate hydratase/homoaconitate hydratase
VAQAQAVTGRALCFGDNIDTDAIIPGEFCNLTSLAELGAHCFHYTRPEMRGLAAAGQNIIVAGQGWGCGSSREHAAWALKGAGARAVIARSFAVIHRRNLVNEGLPVIVMRDEAFFATVDEGDALELDARTGAVYHPASGRRFHGEPPAAIEAAILGQGGLIPA